MGCSSDNTSSEPNTSGTKLVAVHTEWSGSMNYTNYTYSGDYLHTGQTNNGPVAYYHYTGNLITSISGPDGSDEIAYTYDSEERVVEKNWMNGNLKETYSYPDVDTILIQLYINEELREVQTLHMVQNEIASFENEILDDEGNWEFSSYSFTFDDKNCPRTGWIGFDKISYTMGNRVNVLGRYHNVLSAIETTPGATIPNSAWYAISYNDQDYPSIIEVVDENGINQAGYVMEFFYTD